jgi:hypothetical protein
MNTCRFVCFFSCVALCLALLLHPLAQAQSAAAAPAAEVKAELPDARTLGAARMRFFGMDIYDARLFAPALKRSDYTASPFALEVQYLRGFDGSSIAERSLKEMRRIGNISPEKEKTWLDAMRQAFPDVKSGDRITGFHKPGVGTRFFVNGLARASIDDPEFSRYFFGIWLSPHTSEPKMRTELLAGASD